MNVESNIAGSVQSVARALTLIDTVESAGGITTLTELATMTGLSAATVHRLVQTLVTAGYLRQLPDRRYCLGSRLATLGNSANALISVHARPLLSTLAAELGETANLAVLTAGSAEYVAQISGRHSMRTFTEVGHRVPLHCTGVGKALLSTLADDQVRQLLDDAGMPAKTSTTITDIASMLIELAAIRDRGYAIDEGEMELGVRCVATAVHAGTYLAVSVSGPALRVTDDFIQHAAPALAQCSAQLAELLTPQR